MIPYFFPFLATASFMSLPGLKAGTRVAAILMASPVRGFLPVRAVRERISKEPKPGSTTLPSDTRPSVTASSTALRESDGRIKELNEQIHYIGQYFANKTVHGDFLNAKDKKSFREKHSAELDLYNAARTFLKKSFPDKVPTISKLKAERDALIQEKKEKTNRYHAAKAAQKDLFTARTNVARLLDEPIVFEKSKEATL